MKLDRACGAERWRVAVTGGSVRFPLVVDGDGTIYGSISGQAKVYDRLVAHSADGKPKWTVDLKTASPGELEYGTVGPIGADGALYTVIANRALGEPAGPSRVRAYSRAGLELWSVPVPGLSVQTTGGQPVLRSDGLLVLGGTVSETGPDKAYLFAVQTPSPGLTKSAWPRALHDNQSSANLSTPL